MRIGQYTEKLENLLADYNASVSEWKRNGRWAELSEPRKEDFQLYTERLKFMLKDSRERLEQATSGAVSEIGKENVNS